MAIRLVLFDLDDTLCDHSASFRLRVQRALAVIPADRLTLPPQTVVEAALIQPSHTWEGLEHVLVQAGATDPELLERAFAAYTSDRFFGLELFPDSLSVVRGLQRRLLTGLVTNGPSVIQRAKLERLGIEHLFPIVVVSEEIGVAKPDPAIFAHALALAGVRPEEALYVGDHPLNDVIGARRAGLVSVWCDRFGRQWTREERPPLVIRSLWELYCIVERWASGDASEPRPGGILGLG